MDNTVEVQASFAAIAIVDIKPSQNNAQRSKVEAVEVRLELSDNMEESQYFDKENVFTKDGVNALLNGFIQGLATVAKTSETKGLSSFEGMRDRILAELNKTFDMVKEMKG